MSTGDKSIRSDAATYEALRQLAQEHGLSNTKLLAAMVQYFRVTKADPQQPTGPDLTSSLAKITAKLADLDKRTIGFIREQEKQYLKPILAEVQAHKVLSAPAVSAPVGPSEGQVQEVAQWFERVLYRGLQPIALTKEFQAKVEENGATAIAKDPQLERIKKAVVAVIKQAIVPEILTAALNPVPVGLPIPPPTQPA